MIVFLYKVYCHCYVFCKTILRKNEISVGPIFKNKQIRYGNNHLDVVNSWHQFIANSCINIPEWKGFYYAGYIAETSRWCLPSWIWTNAAIIRLLCKHGDTKAAIELGRRLAASQQDCGGWYVRHDYDKKGGFPCLAPNDSAYIANNAFVELYLLTKDDHYLEIAKKCADWIIDSARDDGLVFVGYNARDDRWNQEYIIVDTGFTAGLFSRLYEITCDDKYLIFLKTFINRYIDLFFNSDEKAFATSIDSKNRKQGGFFGRGQAWALEGLIPSYRVLKDEKIRMVIDSVIENLLSKQGKNGAWAYNFSKSMLGDDCKGIPIIAKNLMDWNSEFPNKRIIESAKKALSWCICHTSKDGDSKGGIFSFCLEGAIVQELNTSCAFVYASVYAIELDQMLKDE